MFTAGPTTEAVGQRLEVSHPLDEPRVRRRCLVWSTSGFAVGWRVHERARANACKRARRQWREPLRSPTRRCAVAVLSRRCDGIDVFQNNGVNWPGIADLDVWIGIA